MCGIAGIYRFAGATSADESKVHEAITKLQHRGPDHQAVIKASPNAVLGHARLKVIDTSDEANQPMSYGDSSIVYNGEVYNYQSIQRLFNLNCSTTSDTEVLLRTLDLGTEHVRHFNGCFAIGYMQNNSLTLLRDRYGIKPLYWFRNDEYVAFSSELESIQSLVQNLQIDNEVAVLYHQLTYTPGNLGILDGIEKVPAGGKVEVNGTEVVQSTWYQKQTKPSQNPVEELRELMEIAVSDRLIADVPLGTFLSGGTDSSIISALAKRHKDDLHTFSVGYPDHPHYDERKYGQLVASHIDSEHHAIQMGNAELEESALELLENLSEPFADSSAIAMNWLCKQTRKDVTVVLSGDGADELFGGYNKHLAMMQMASGGWKDTAIKGLATLTSNTGGNRDSKSANLVRKAQRYKEASSLSERDRYWFLATFTPEEYVLSLINNDRARYLNTKSHLLEYSMSSLNDILLQDQSLVLQGDMLRKADLCSMLHGLEVRVPFMDHRVVEFANGLQTKHKIDGKRQKAILQDAFEDLLPGPIFERSKHGFEVPLHDLLNGPLRQKVFSELLHEDAITSSGIFNPLKVAQLIEQFNAMNSATYTAAIWSIACFQSWYFRTISND